MHVTMFIKHLHDKNFNIKFCITGVKLSLQWLSSIWKVKYAWSEMSVLNKNACNIDCLVSLREKIALVEIIVSGLNMSNSGFVRNLGFE